MPIFIDITLKDIIDGKPKKFLKQLIGAEDGEILDIEFTETKLRRPDVVIRLKDGVINHIELQASNDKDMPYRMLEYMLLLLKQFKGYIIKQQVLYVGQSELTMQNKIEVGDLSYRFTIVNIKDISCDELLASDTIYDVILTILCDSGSDVQKIRAVLQRIAQIKDDNERADVFIKLMQLGRLRQIQQIITEEVEKMPVTIEVENVEKDFFYKQGMQQGMQQGVQQGLKQGMVSGLCKGLALALEAKFGIKSSEWVSMLEKINDVHELEKAYEVFKVSQSLEEFKQYLVSHQSNATN